jgi:hypothetical protein
LPDELELVELEPHAAIPITAASVTATALMRLVRTFVSPCLF